MAKFLTGFKAKLVGAMSVTDGVLRVSSSDADKLCEMLGGDYSYLPLGTEVARVECQDGVPVLTRGDNPVALPSGECIKFEVTEALIKDAVNGPDTVCSIEGDEFDVERDGCKVTLSLKKDRCNSAEWTALNGKFKFDGSCVVKTADAVCSVAPGTYENATVTIGDDGAICAIRQGTNIVYSQTSCCGNCGCDGDKEDQ